MKIVVLGGYGNFGARIARALAGDPAIELVVAGRNLRKAEVLARGLGAHAVCIDAASGDLALQLKASGVELVIHTAGPFQGQDYAVARAAAAAGCHYIDLADGRRFVCDFQDRLDAEFRRAGRVAITGASTVPALSSGVVDELGSRLARLEEIDICIAPAQKAPRGQATLAAVLSYCGAPVQVWQGAHWRKQPGWASPVPVQFARMKQRLGALGDIPDLELFVPRYAGVQDVMFRAALEVQLSQRVFAWMAWLRRVGLLRQPQALAALMHRAGIVLDGLGTPVGGMVVRVRGRGHDGVARRLAWHITAGNHHGPEIPCMAAIVLARRLARGDALPAGALPCMGLVKLAEFQPEFERWGMVVDWEEGAA